MEIDHGFTTDMRYAIAGTFTGGLSSKGYRLLKNEWYKVQSVYPICADQDEVEGDKTYRSLKDLPEPVDVVVVVHKKALAADVVREAATLDPKPAIWFMPGTDSKESIAICEDNDMKYAKSCVFMHRKLPGIKRFFSYHNWHATLTGANKIPKQPEI
ncbi:MAG: CoA-binding protein [Candidatus Heimdallarchaeota archaeon]